MRLTITVETDDPSLSKGWLTMADEWLKSLIQNAETKDQAAANTDAMAGHRRSVIVQKGPIYWRAFSDFLLKYWSEAEASWTDQTTKSKFTAAANPGSATITLGKEAYPTVKMNAAANFAGEAVTLWLTVVHPKLQGTPNQQKGIPCRFETDGHEVSMQLNGAVYGHPQEAARALIELIFS